MLMEHPGRPDGGDGGFEADAGTLLKNVLEILRRRYLVLVAVTAGVMGLAIVALLLATPRYNGVARVRIDPKPVQSNGTSSDVPAQPDQAVVDTEVSVIRSRDIAAAVVRELHLERTAEFAPKPGPDTDAMSPQERFDTVVANVARNLDVAREKSTYLVDIGFKSVEPARAAAIANAFAANYIKATVARRTGTAEQQYAFLDKRLQELRAQANEASGRLAQYKASNGLMEGGQLGTVTDQQVAPLSTQLATAQAEAASAGSDLSVARSQMAAGGAAAASSVLNSPAIQSLRTNRAQVEQTLSQLSARYGPRHPQTIQAEQQLDAIDRGIKEEAKRIIGELTAKKSAADAQAGSLSGDLARLTGRQASNARLSAGADSLQRDADAKNNAFNSLAQLVQQNNLGAQSSLSQAQIIERAPVPERPSSPKVKLTLAAALLLSLALGLGLIAVLEIMSTGLMTAAEVERRLELKLLTSVPLLGAKEIGAATPADALMAHPMSPYAEAFRTLRSSLLLAGDQSPKVIALLSTLPSEGKTTSTLSLARVMALAGDRTLVIDGDIRRTGLGSLVPRRPHVGLVEVLRDGANVAEAIVPDSVPGLDVLTTSGPSFIPDDLFGSGRMARLLDELRGRYDRIVFDTPPLLGVADARTIAVLCDAVVLALKWNATPRSAIADGVKWLRLDQAKLAGAMFTMVSPKAEAFGALYYSRAYANYYQQG